MFETYRPSGKFGAMAIPLWLVAVVTAIPLALVYVMVLEWIPLIYVSFLSTLLAGWLLGLLAYYVCSFGHVRNSMIAWLIGLSLPVMFIAAKFICQWQYLAPDFEFLEFIEARVDQGWNIGRRGQNTQINGFFVYAIWLIEAGIIFYRSPFRAAQQARSPYSEPLNQWASEQEQIMVLPISDEDMIVKIKAASTVDQLLEIPIPKTDEATQFAIYNVNSIPGQEMEDAYLSVSLMDLVVGSDGEVEQKLSPLVQNAILTSTQRHLLAENASLLKEAMDDYRQSVEEEFNAGEDQIADANDGNESH